MPASAVDRETTMVLYCNLMAEIKTRHATVVAMFNNPHPMPGEFLAEFCYLQLRKMCELLAVACLAVHGDIEQTRTGRLRGAWNAEFIIKALGKLNPDFYPVPVMFGPGREPNGPALFEPIADGYLTKAELLSLYNVECAQLMHLGSLDQLLSGEKIVVDKSKLESWFIKMQRLLTNHRILLYGSNEEIWVDMSLPESEVEARLVTRSVSPT